MVLIANLKVGKWIRISKYELNAFCRKNWSIHIYVHVLLVVIQKLLTLYKFTKFTKVGRFFQNIPKRIMSVALLKGSLLHPKPNIQKMDCILQVNWP